MEAERANGTAPLEQLEARLRECIASLGWRVQGLALVSETDRDGEERLELRLRLCAVKTAREFAAEAAEALAAKAREAAVVARAERRRRRRQREVVMEAARSEVYAEVRRDQDARLVAAQGTRSAFNLPVSVCSIRYARPQSQSAGAHFRLSLTYWCGGAGPCASRLARHWRRARR